MQLKGKTLPYKNSLPVGWLMVYLVVLMVFMVVLWLVRHMVSINDTRYRTEVGVCTTLGHRTATNFATQFRCSMCRHGLKKNQIMDWFWQISKVMGKNNKNHWWKKQVLWKELIFKLISVNLIEQRWLNPRTTHYHHYIALEIIQL